jgi:hypothetical protein
MADFVAEVSDDASEWVAGMMLLMRLSALCSLAAVSALHATKLDAT